jgi:hypothetical protein
MLAVKWGTSGDVPQTADYDGHLKQDLAVYPLSDSTATSTAAVVRRASFSGDHNSISQRQRPIEYRVRLKSWLRSDRSKRVFLINSKRSGGARSHRFFATDGGFL